MKKVLLLVLVLVALLAIWGVKVYNGLVTNQENVERAVGNVQTAYQKRADLIPNLVATVKNYAEYEANTQIAVVEARAKAAGSITIDPTNLTEESLNAYLNAQNELSGALKNLLVTVEQYPDLKANQNYLDLQNQLESCENGIANARREFNETTMAYNTAVRKFPGNIIAGMFGFAEKPYFKAADGAEQVPNVGDLFN